MADLPTTEDILASVIDKIRSEDDEPDTRWWTARIKKLVTDALDFRGSCTMCGSGMNGWGPEYMLDVSVSRDNIELEDPDDPYAYTELLLAVECEWNPKHYERGYDFGKLADIRAARKVFVGGVRASEWATVQQDIVQRMLDFVNRHSRVPEGEEYGVLLFGYGRDDGAMASWVLRKGDREPLVVLPPTSAT